MIDGLLSRLPDGFDLRIEPVPYVIDQYKVTLSRLSLPDKQGWRRTVVHAIAIAPGPALHDVVAQATEKIEP